MITGMKKHFFLVICFVFLIANEIVAISKVCFKTFCFNVKLANTAAERQVGLTQTPVLKTNEGMLFLYASKGYYSYWMKGMSYPIDILWLDEHRKIISMQEGVPPCILEDCPLFSSSQQALYVLEIPAGSSKNLRLSYGSQATFK